jgi:hypothetical protein
VASAATFHVSPSGSNTPPYDTYTKAAHQVADAMLASSGYGDTVLVHAGTYDIDTTLDLPVGVNWAGVGRDSVALIWRGGVSQNLMSRAYGDNEVWGLTVVNPDSIFGDFLIGIASFLHSLSFKLRDSRFEKATVWVGPLNTAEISQNEIVVWLNDGIKTDGYGSIWIHHNTFRSGPSVFGTAPGIVATEGDVLVEHNVFDFTPSEGRGVMVKADRFPQPMTVRNNLFIGGRRAIIWDFCNGSIENNTIIGQRGAEGAIDCFQDSTDTLMIRNNVFVDVAAVPTFGNRCYSCAPTGPITYIYNAFWPPVDSFYRSYFTIIPSRVNIKDSANFNAFPMFADDSTYTLQLGSPLIDSGDPSLKDADSTRSDIGWWGGPGGSASAYPDLPPAAPESLKYDYAYPAVSLWWHANYEADLQNYAIHRDNHSGFIPTEANRVGTASAGDTTFADTLHDTLTAAYYKVVAIDTTEHESPPSNEVAVIPTGVLDPEEPQTGVPLTPRLLGNYPNPFNASTVFEVFIPTVGASPAPMEIIIFDALGRRAAIAYSGPMTPGTHQITWDGCDSEGHALASGVYFAKLKFWSLTISESVKVVIVR